MDNNTRDFLADGKWISEILDASNIGLWSIRLDPVTNIGQLFCNDTMLRLLGLTFDMLPEKAYRYWYSRIDKSYVYAMRKMIRQIIDTKHHYEVQYLWNHPTQGKIYMRCGGILKFADPSCIHLRGYHQDITEIENIKKALEIKNHKLSEIQRLTDEIEKLKEHYHHLAYIDALTGLPNRRSFFELAGSFYSRIEDMEHPLWIIMADIDLFKQVNDTYGHLAGDEVLREAAFRFKRLLREKLDFVARIGGEEFAFLISDTPECNCTQIAERLRRGFSDEPFALHTGEELSLTCSFGISKISKIPSKSASANYCIESAIQNADTALYKAKNNGRNKVVLYPNLNPC